MALAAYRRVYLAYVVMGGVVVVSAVMVGLLGLSVVVAVGLALLATGFVWTVWRRTQEFARYRHLPGPVPELGMGNLDVFLRHGHAHRDRALAQLHEEYGPVVRLHLGWGSPALVSVCSEDTRRLHDPQLDSVRTADRGVLGHNLMGIRGSALHRHRRSVLRPFLKKKAVGQRVEAAQLVLEESLGRWARERPAGARLQQEILLWSIHSLGHALCGDDWDRERDVSRYHASIEGIEEVISTRAFHPPFVRWLDRRAARQARADVSYFYAFSAELLERRLARSGDVASAPEDVLGLLARLSTSGHRHSEGEVVRWSRAECIGELVSLLAGGTDAICHLATQVVAQLAENPEVQSRVADALRRGLPVEDLVIQEVLRLAPALPFSAKISESGPFSIAGVEIPAGTMVIPFRSGIGRDPERFPDPKRFDPFRFASGCPRRQHLRTTLPFGAGPRTCPGQGLTMGLVGRFVREVVMRFEVTPGPVVATELSATIAARASGLSVRLVPRSPGGSARPQDGARSRLESSL